MPEKTLHRLRRHPSGRGELRLPYNPRLKKYAKELRKAGVLSEVIFWQQIKNKQIFNLNFDRQKIIGNYIVDFYCKELRLVIEIDGVSHDGKGDYDQKRKEYLESLGLNIIIFSDIDIKKNPEGCLNYLKAHITNE